ncbi:hypothetical protein HZS_5003 [Henneguya salminicola]|nr:hypothetical protein HZS_5003 [Henneguya salminicola]
MLAKFYVSCNEIPSFDCYDQALSNRMRFGNFETKFNFKPKHNNEKKIDKTLYKKVKSDTDYYVFFMILLLRNIKKLTLERLDEIIDQNVISEEEEMLMKFQTWCLLHVKKDDELTDIIPFSIAKVLCMGLSMVCFYVLSRKRINENFGDLEY